MLVAIVSLILNELTYRQDRLRTHLVEQERLNVAVMAVQSHHDTLSINGVTVTVTRTEQGIGVYSEGKELIHVNKD